MFGYYKAVSLHHLIESSPFDYFCSRQQCTWHPGREVDLEKKQFVKISEVQPRLVSSFEELNEKWLAVGGNIGIHRL